jgi:uncharacterized membrane protein YbaN (DUF454 family)
MIGLCIVGVVLFSFAKSIIVIVVVVSKISYRKLRKWVHRKLNYNKWQRINKIKELEIQRKEKETKMLLKAIKGLILLVSEFMELTMFEYREQITCS